MAAFAGTALLLVGIKLLMEIDRDGSDIYVLIRTGANDLIVALLGMFAVLIALSELNVVRKAVGTQRVRSILNAALFTALFVPFAWAGLSLCSRVTGNAADLYVFLLIGLSFSLFLRADRLAHRARRKMRAKMAQAGGVKCYEMDYAQVIEMIREQDPDTAGKVILFGMPKSLTDISICSSMQIGKEEILSYASRHFKCNVTNLIHDQDIQRVIFLAV